MAALALLLVGACRMPGPPEYCQWSSSSIGTSSADAHAFARREPNEARVQEKRLATLQLQLAAEVEYYKVRRA